MVYSDYKTANSPLLKADIQVAFNYEDALPGRPAMFTQMCASLSKAILRDGNTLKPVQ